MDTNQFLDKLQSEKIAFLDDLRPKYITPSLVKNKVITQIEEKDILAELKPSEQVEKLFVILSKKTNPRSFKYFLKALTEDEDGCSTYPWLAKKLETMSNLNDKVHNILVNGNIPFQVNYLLHRHEKINLIRKHLKTVTESKRRHWIVLYGPIGSGKSVLAAEAVRNNDIIENYFPGGVYWIHIGSVKDGDAIKLKIRKLLKLMEYKNELHPNESLYDLNLILKKEVCKKPKMLVILDDVWYSEAIKAFDIGCIILVSTKNKNALFSVSHYCTDIECKYDLQLDEISVLLSKHVQCEPEDLPEVVKDIRMKCKGSPLLTSLIGSMMAVVGNNTKKWIDINNRLEERGTDTLRRRFNSGDSDRDLNKIINLCLEPIQHLKDCYLDFLIFHKDIPVPYEVLEMLWEEKGFDVDLVMYELCNRCFVQKEPSEEGDVSYSYTAHDLYLDTLKDGIGDTEEIENRHKKLVKKILELSLMPGGKIDLSKLPKSYIPFTIGYHLFCAREWVMLEELYLDLHFVNQKIHFTVDVMDILLDYRQYRACFTNKDHVEMFEAFLTRNAVAFAKKKSDIIQLALFEPADSIVYQNAREVADKLNLKKYYDWCNKDENNPNLFNYTIKYGFDGAKHAVINSNGSKVASVGDGIGLIWSSSSGEKLQELHGHSDTINYCVFNSTGDRLATASADKTVRIFKIEGSLTSSGNYSNKRSSQPTLNLTQDKNRDNSIFTFTEHEYDVVCCAYSPDDNYIISSDFTGKTYVWFTGTSENAETSIIEHQVSHSHKKHCFSFCCFSNDGRTFGTAVYDTIKLWDFLTGLLKVTFHHKEYLVNQFCFIDNDTHVLSISDNVISKWDVEKEEKVSVISTGRSKAYVICSMCLSPDGNYIACGTTSASIIVINIHSQVVVDNLRGHSSDVINVMFTKDGKRLFSASSNRYIIHDMAHIKDTPLTSFEGNLSVQFMNQHITIASSNYFNCLEIRNGFDGKLVATSPPEESDISACSLSRDCSHVVYGTKSGDVKVFTIATNSSIELSPKHAGQVNYILHSVTDSTFFTCSEDKTVRIWKERCKAPLILKGHTQSVLMCVQFKTCNKLLSCSKDGSLRVWDTVSGELILPITEGHGNQDVRFCDISPLEDRLASASADETIKVWNAQNGELLKQFEFGKEDRNSSVRCCRFSPSSKILISGHDNGKVILCHLLGNRDYQVLRGCHDSMVYNIHFAMDSSAQFLSISNEIKLWNRNAQLQQTVLLPSSCMGVDPPSIWTSHDFDILVIISNSILYILKKIK